jgi:hypothetical protein
LVLDFGPFEERQQADGIAFVAPNEEPVVGGGAMVVVPTTTTTTTAPSFLPFSCRIIQEYWKRATLSNWIIVLLKLSTGRTLHPGGLIPL